METNVIQLHEYLYDDADYVPSDTVKDTSAQIVNATGITKDTEGIDTSNYNETVGADGTEATKTQNKESKTQNTETENQ